MRNASVTAAVGASAMNDDLKRRQLRQMKAIALGFLVVAAIVFVIARLLEDDHHWLGYVRATAEAAMVGALADWFAVTALFRHPLRVPIPHTAIIPKRKNEIGESLGSFVQENFLSAAVIGEKLREARVAERAADWLVQPAHAERVAGQVAAVLGGAVDVLRDDEITGLIEDAVVGRLRSVDVAPTAGRVLDLMTESGRHREVFDAALNGVGRMLDERRLTLREAFAKESPWWVPAPIDDRVFDRIFAGVQNTIRDVLADPNHALRSHVDERVTALVAELKTSPEMAARGAALRDEVLDHPAVRTWTLSIWADLKESLVRQAADPDSGLRRRLADGIVSIASTVREDPTLQTKINRWIEEAVDYLATQYRGEVAHLISSTVAKWDPDETSERIELQIGRDLQFIRMNGTIVGGLVGLAIYSVGQLL
jgi:uncharacterized membrane-anchored protein YjiN (DUF445 family)